VSTQRSPQVLPQVLLFRSHAGTTERSAGRSRRPLRRRLGDGRNQRRLPRDRSGARDRGQRHSQQRRRRRPQLADRGNAGVERVEVGSRDRDEKVAGSGLRGRRQSGLLQGQHVDVAR
jgi:hypothetical protein